MRKAKGRKFYVVLGLVVAAAFGIVLYLNLRPDNGYRSAIHRDAKAVMVVDFTQTAQNLGFTVKDLMLHYNKMSNTGVDFTKPLYGFVAQNGNMGLVASVTNAEQLDENLKTEPYVVNNVWQDIRIDTCNVAIKDDVLITK